MFFYILIYYKMTPKNIKFYMNGISHENEQDQQFEYDINYDFKVLKYRWIIEFMTSNTDN